METQAAELIADSALTDCMRRTGGQVREMLAQIGTAEALGEQAKKDQSLSQRLGTWIGKSQT